MNTSKIVRSAKCGVLGALVAMGLTAFAEPTVTVGEVTAGEPWSTITVNYTLGGTDATLNYKVAFDITAGGQTASVTNDAAKLADGAATKEIDTAKLFGKEVVDTKAKVKVTLIAIKPKAPGGSGGVQLWEGGPFWAEANLGESEVQDHPEYGALYTFDNADAAVKTLLGQEWRVPSRDDFDKLRNTSYCTRTWDAVKKGYTFTGAKEGFEDKSIFLPVAGYGNGTDRVVDDFGDFGHYWSSSENENSDKAWILYFSSYLVNEVAFDRGIFLSVRPVRGFAK